MQTLDTTKFIIPIDALNSIDHSKFLIKETSDHENNSKGIIRVLDSDYKLPGIRNISIINDSTIQIELSAKILADNYLQGININTIEQAFTRLNDAGIDLNINDAIESGGIRCCDITSGVYMAKDEFSSLKIAMMATMMHPKLRIESYTDTGNEGIEFKGIWRTKKERLIIYPKDDEMRPIASNKAFLSTCIDPQKVSDQFKDLKRVECNLKTFEALKGQLKMQGKDNLPILDVLTNKEKVSYNLIRKYIKVDFEALNKLDQYKNMKMTDQLKMMGMISLVKEFDHDERKIINYLKLKQGKNWVRDWSGRGGKIGIRHVLASELAKQNNAKAKPGEMAILLNDFMNKLKKAI
jgi:hypothetical protein